MKTLLKLCLLVVLLIPFSLSAQFYNGSQLEFGKNRVQYRNFIWTFYLFDDFDVYFYREGQPLAEYTARYTEEVLPEFERKLETTLNEKIQFVVFNNLTDLKQSNIGLEKDEEYNTGGVTKIAGRKVILYFDGDYHHFRTQIRAGIANVLIKQLLYGGSIGSQIKNTTLFQLPDWYLDGLLSYLSMDWNTRIDNHVRDGIQSGYYKKFNHLTGEDAVYAGHSLWKYIAEVYGRSAVPNILHMTNISRSIENGFMYVIQVSFKTLMKDWRAYYREYYKNQELFDELPQDPMVKKPGKEVFYDQLKVSPDGRYAVYITNELGRFIVWLKDLQSGKKKKVFKGGFKLGVNTDYSYPITAWHPNGEILSFILERKGYVYLYLYTPAEKKLEKRILINFEKILDYAYSPDGTKLVMSAVHLGRSDIYVFDIPSGSHKQLTDDMYDDLNPRFVRNSKNIVFSSNRPGDTLFFEKDSIPLDMPDNNDIFLYDYQTNSPVLKRLTETQLANEIQPMEYDKGYITYLSDENGIYNQYVGRFDSTIARVDTAVHYRYFMDAFPVTNYPRNINYLHISPESGKQSKIFYNNRSYRSFIQEKPEVNQLNGSELTTTPFMEELQDKKAEMAIVQKKRARPGKPERPRKRFRNVSRGEAEQDENIDIENYEFRKQSVIRIEGDKLGQTQRKTALAKEEGFQLPKRRNYKVEYFFNEVTTQVDFTFLNATYEPFTGGGAPIFLNPGFNALFKVGVSDLLEDYRIIGGVRLNSNLVNNEYLLTFINLKNRLDKQYVFHRQIIEYIGSSSIVRFHTNEVFHMLSWPFNEAMRVKGTVSLRNDRAVYLTTDQNNLENPGFDENWAGLKLAFNYDDTRNVGLNLYYGTRYKIWGEYYQLIDEDTRNLIVLGADFRHYTKIHRQFIWANRFAVSTSFGKNKLIYYMGGEDNWLFPKFNQETPIDYSQNYRYQTLATNMRGFNQNIRNGNSFFVINSELRFPVFKYFFNRPIRSDFLSNFQIIGFGDLGTAWTGWNPYSRENILYKRQVQNGPILVEYEVQKEPIVAGFGGGVRTRILGYFLRADWAWGLEDGVVNDGIFYLSLSLDF